MEVVTLETGIDHYAVLVGIVGGEGIAALGGAAAHRQLVCLAKGRAKHGSLPVGAGTESRDLLIGIAALVVEICLLESSPFAGRHQVEFLCRHVEAGSVAIID